MPRGGKREGAGRKAVDGAKIEGKVLMSLDSKTIELFDDLGEGNISLGARKAARIILGLQSNSPPRKLGAPAAGQSMRLPVRKIAPEKDKDGRLYNITTQLRMQEKLDQEYEAAMLRYKESGGE